MITISNELELFNSVRGMQTFSRMIHICHYAMMVQNIPGDIVEFGCFVGDTAKVLTGITNKKVYVYDSFKGLPDNNIVGSGDMSCSVDDLAKNFRKDNIKLPMIFKGYFNEIKEKDLPKQISFAHLDGDLYSSILESLELIYDKMATGGVILIDDYEDQKWHGVDKAAKEFFKDKPESIVHLPGVSNTLSNKGLIIKI